MSTQPPTSTFPPNPRRRRVGLALSAGAVAVVLGTLTALIPGHLGLPIPSTTAPTSITNDALKTGCPGTAQDPKWTKAANITIHDSDANNITNAHIGDTIQVLLPAGYRWAALSNAEQPLHLESPMGYYDSAAKICGWHYSVVSAGATILQFTRQPICQAGKACSPLVITYRFVVNIA